MAEWLASVARKASASPSVSAWRPLAASSAVARMPSARRQGRAFPNSDFMEYLMAWKIWIWERRGKRFHCLGFVAGRNVARSFARFEDVGFVVALRHTVGAGEI